MSVNVQNNTAMPQSMTFGGGKAKATKGAVKKVQEMVDTSSYFEKPHEEFRILAQNHAIDKLDFTNIKTLIKSLFENL